MSNQLTNNAEALRLFFTEDIYLVKDIQRVDFTKNTVAKSDLARVDDEPKEVFVEIPEISRKQFDFKYLGKNQKQILILVNDNANEVSTENGRELLRKIVKAISLTANDFALLNYANFKEAAFDDLNDFFKCKLVLAFGVGAEKLGLPNNPLHQITHFKEIKLVFTHNLHDLDNDNESKKLLWGSLKQLNNNG